MKTSIAYEQITSKIIESMESGNVPWRKPWNSTGPRNLFSGKAYRGVNVWLLEMMGVSVPAFATFNQVKQHGGSIKKGSKSSTIFFFSKFSKTEENKDGEEVTRNIPLMRTYNVFSLDQIEGIDFSKYLEEKTDFEPNLDAETLINSFIERENLSVGFGGDRAYYAPSLDHVQLPNKEDFKGPCEYYSTYYHELGHATGAAQRLNREGVAGMNNHGRGEVYSFEELVAELTSSYLCALTGIDNELETEQSAAYIKSWLKVLKDDKAMIWKAASHAQRAVDYILKAANEQTENEEEAPF